MIVDLQPFTGISAKVVLLRRSDFAAFYQVVIENIYSPLLSHIKEGDVVIDAGANIGLFSILASFKVKDKGKVIVIEPEPNNLKILKQNVELNKLNNIIVIPKALYDKPGKMVSIKGEGVGAYVSEDGEGLVETTTIDKIAEETSLKPRILKMDIEGSEVKALTGGINTLKHLELIEIEVHDEENMEKVEEILSGFRKRELAIEDLGNVYKQFLKHPFGLLRIEMANRFSTTKRVLLSKIKKESSNTAQYPKQIVYYRLRNDPS
ncbi:methyltransferase, FkbM family [Metallosphaera yellowstonensis MK1]|uniref:Methyltransferase, FkbM family n=1 Tax=Metallosphaera yellowstonensis MK1 TaxID=671065 RepID=H2C9R9_9CREN|nr:FkbM family methyltransferase [Metallosphaera yellowstonensis]EHP68895.1 methyltransferase, FkbM family [Metallosphaera yellowstonensis MK1]